MSGAADDSRTEDFERAATDAVRTIGGVPVEIEPGPTGLAGETGRRPLDREQVIATLRAHEADLRARGVLHVALFGSLARGEAGPDSDIDIMLDIAPERPMGLWEYASIEEFLSSLFATPVDVSECGALKPLVRPCAERDAVYAF